MRPSHAPAHAPAVFPPVRAHNLNRRTFNLPADFEGERNLVILAFQRKQQALVDPWTAAIRELLARYPDLHFYELPSISRGNPLFRAWLDGAMRGGFPTARAANRPSRCTWTNSPFDRRLTCGTKTPSTSYWLIARATSPGEQRANTPISSRPN